MNKTNQIKNYFKVYLQEAECAKGLSKNTLVGYSEVIQTFLNIMPELSLIGELNPNIIVEFYKRLHRRAKSNNKKIKTSTIYTYHSKLNVFFGWLEHQGYIQKGSLYNQVPKPQQPSYSDVKALTNYQVEIILATISVETIYNTFLRVRDMTLLYTLLYTGIRRGELLGLRIQDIDLENESLYIRGKTSKSKKGRRIPINPILLLSLKKYLGLLYKRKTRCGYLFISSKKDTPLTTHGLKALIDKYRRLSGVKFSAHQLRHTFACALAKENADMVSIRCALGHSSITMTERYLRSIGSENTRVFINRLSF